MSGVLINLIVQIIAGAIGGNVAGGASKDLNLGTAGNTIAGAIGGGVGGQILGAFIPLLANTASTIDIGALVGQAAGGGVAGAILTAVVGLIKNRMADTRRVDSVTAEILFLEREDADHVSDRFLYSLYPAGSCGPDLGADEIIYRDAYRTGKLCDVYVESVIVGEHDGFRP